MITKEQKEQYKELLKERKGVQKQSYKQTRKALLACVAVGVVIGLFIAFEGIKADIAGIMDIKTFKLYFYFGFILFCILFIIDIVLHEAGHLVFGLLTGYRFLSFRIFSTIFYKKDGHIYKKKYSIKGTAGQCLMYPPVRREDQSFPYVLYNLGGGISNLIFSLPFIIPAALTGNTLMKVIYLVIVFSGVLTAATNLIPMNVGLQNDGMNLKSMLEDDDMQEAFYLQLKVNAQMSDGKLITDYPPEVFELPEGADDVNMLTVYVRLSSYYQKLANHDYEAAENLLSEMAEKSELYQPATLNMIEAERLFFMVLRHNPSEEIAALYEYIRWLFI
jgi:hypothetical protein